MPPEFFSERMNILKQSGCNVLPLDEALQRLYTGTLPEMSVSLTFDDGAYDFYKQAFPIIKANGFPVTVYLTTFFCEYNRPVFDVMIAYLLWKGRKAMLNLRPLINKQQTLDLSNSAARAVARNILIEFAWINTLSAQEKDALAIGVAKAVGIDYDELVADRILHVLAPEEVKHLAAEGVDIQLHTHRHRNPTIQELFSREILQNRSIIQHLTGYLAKHFCYPGNVYYEEYLVWLKELGILSATTCEPGLIARDCHPLLLPRLMDSFLLPRIEFEGWLTGLSSLLPRRAPRLPQLTPLPDTQASDHGSAKAYVPLK
jgi:peptidoglycan/xylan/chitin deacetylase (PgdA/CDA1 family)